jgi:hypothetical protein
LHATRFVLSTAVIAAYKKDVAIVADAVARQEFSPRHQKCFHNNEEQEGADAGFLTFKHKEKWWL